MNPVNNIQKKDKSNNEKYIPQKLKNINTSSFFYSGTKSKNNDETSIRIGKNLNNNNRNTNSNEEDDKDENDKVLMSEIFDDYNNDERNENNYNIEKISDFYNVNSNH